MNKLQSKLKEIKAAYIVESIHMKYINQRLHIVFSQQLFIIHKDINNLK